MAAAPRGVEAHSLLGGSYPLMTDAVEKVGATLTTRNNRIAQAGFLNRSCAFDARLESILLEDPLKIFFRQYRSRAEKLASSKSGPLLLQQRTQERTSTQVAVGPTGVIESAKPPAGIQWHYKDSGSTHDLGHQAGM